MEVLIDDRRRRWLEKKVGKISSSMLPDLMFGYPKWKNKTALNVLYAVKYGRRTNVLIPEKSNKNFDFGHENEPFAIEWVRSTTLNKVVNCSEDLPEIVFNETMYGFGDSPDFQIYTPACDKIQIVGEVKCPISVQELESEWELEKITPNHKYYDQFIGHFIGEPEAESLMYVIYDAYADQIKPIMMYRKDHEFMIEAVKQRIADANYVIDHCLKYGSKIEDIEEILKRRIV